MAAWENDLLKNYLKAVLAIRYERAWPETYAGKKCIELSTLSPCSRASNL